jgi:hypothetical protein
VTPETGEDIFDFVSILGFTSILDLVTALDFVITLGLAVILGFFWVLGFITLLGFVFTFGLAGLLGLALLLDFASAITTPLREIFPPSHNKEANIYLSYFNRHRVKKSTFGHAIFSIVKLIKLSI